MKEIIKLISEMQKRSSPVLAWYLFEQHLLKANLRLTATRHDREELLWEVMPESVFYLEQIISGSGAINFYAQAQELVFACEIKSYEQAKRELVTSLPERYQKNERRKQQRIPGELRVVVRDNDQFARGYSLDISSKGFAVVVTEKNRIKWKEEREYLAELQTDDWQLKCKVKVVDSLALKNYELEKHPYASFRLSFKLLDGEEKTEKELEEYIKRYTPLT